MLLPDQQNGLLAQCGLHALNNIFGRPHFSVRDIDKACVEVIHETSEPRSWHVKQGGWYSHSVLAMTLQAGDPPSWRLNVNQLPPSAYTYLLGSPSILGALVDQGNTHWTAIIKHDNALWHVDSTRAPVLLMHRTFAAFILRHPASFAVERI